MPSLERLVEDYQKSTEKLLKEVKKYKDSPKPILIKLSDVLSGVSKVMIAAAALVQPQAAAVAIVLSLGGKFFEGMAKSKKKKEEE